MISRFRQLFRAKPERPPPAIPAGERVYAVGDVHGRLDLFIAAVEAIYADDDSRGQANTTIILLGDLVDRGPESAGVLAAARMLQAERPTRILCGNHEQMFLESFDKLEVLRHFLRHGGRETVLSYPVDPAEYSRSSLIETQELMARVIPQADLDFIRGFEEAIAVGDYLFVHAGINPGTPLEEQSPHDLRWIRDPFLSYRGDFGPVVVHGHTIYDEAQFLPNRIGIDTGAYASGRLTVLGLEGTARWLIETREEDGAVLTETRPLD